MTTLPDRPNLALLIIDVQNAVLAGAYQKERVVANIAYLIEKARSEAVPLVWVQHSSEEVPVGTDGWRFVSELEPSGSEPLIHKKYGDAFEETDLEQVLAERGVGRLLVTGAQTDACIRSTLHGALVRGYDAILVDDAHTTEDLTEWGAPSPDKVIDHTNLYWRFQTAPGREAGTVSTGSVEFVSR